MTEQVFQFRFEAVPARQDSAPTEGGAHVACRIQRPSYPEARAVAERMIEDAGWKIVRFDGSWVVTREDHAPGDPGLPYFEQCLVDGEVAVFHSYPLDDAL